MLFGNLYNRKHVCAFFFLFFFPSNFCVHYKYYQGTAAGGTMEIVVNGTTGLLHPVGKEGVTPLAKNIVKLASHVEKRLTMGKKGYERVKERAFGNEVLLEYLSLAFRN